MMPYDSKWKCIGRGFAGWHASAVDCSSSGGTLEGYLEKAEENALVYDAEESDSEAFINHVMRGPILCHRLSPDEDDKFTDADRKAAARIMPALGGGFKTLAALSQSKSYSGLDKVGIGIYERLLLQIPGIKIGRVVTGRVVWR
jgi:hypothetical protein